MPHYKHRHTDRQSDSSLSLCFTGDTINACTGHCENKTMQLHNVSSSSKNLEKIQSMHA